MDNRFGDEDKKTLRVEHLQTWMDAGYLNTCFAHTTQQSFSVKVIRDLQTGESEGYGVIKFCTHADAEKVFQIYNGTTMPQTEQPFQLNWVSSSMCEKRSDLDSEYSLYVGNLSPYVTNTLLGEYFLKKYPSVTGANVVFDENTCRSKKFGFVTFSDDNERSKAMTEMNGVYFHGRPMHTSFSNCRRSFGSQQQSSSQGVCASGGAFAQKIECDGYSINTTIYVGGLDPSVSLEDLRQTFSQYGETTSVRIPGGKGFGFVEFVNRSSAEEALLKLNRTVIGKQTVYLSWCKNPANKQVRVDRGNQWSGTYYGSQISEGYGYSATPHSDYSTSGRAYGTYPVYGNYQQQEFSAITQHDKSIQPLSSPTIPDMATQPTPSTAKDKFCENDPSSSGNLSGWVVSESTPNETHTALDAVFSVQEYVGQSASKGITEILRPLKKASKGEVTEAPVSLQDCHARGLSFGNHADVESEIVLSSTTKGRELEVANKDMTVVHSESRQLLSSSSEERKRLTPCLEKCNPPIVEENGGKKRSGGRPQAVSLGMALESKEEPQPLIPKQIDLQEVGGVANQTENLLKRKRGRPKGSGQKRKRGRREAVSLGMTFEVKDPELEAGSKEMTFIQTECTKPLSPTEEENPTSFPCHENSDAPMSENNGDQQLMPNVAISAEDASTNGFKHTESSNVAGNSLNLVESVDDHYNNARGYESDTHFSVEGTTATHSSPSRHIGRVLPLAHRSLPFIKSSLLWGSVESMEVFKILPQQPHFRPLEQYNEVAREGMAIGKMLIFANLMERTGKVKPDEPRSMFEDKLEALTDIEECGFTVQPVRTRLEELLSIKDSIDELDDKSKAIEKEVIDEKLKCDEVEDSLKQLNIELQVLVMDKETKDRNVAKLQRTVDEMEESIEGVRSDFNRLVAAPW